MSKETQRYLLPLKERLFMEAARRLFTTVTPLATSPAAEVLVKRDQYPKRLPEERLAVTAQFSC